MTDLQKRDEQDRQVAFDAEQKVKEAVSRGKEAMWELAEALYEFSEASGWLRLGHESLEEWLAQPDVGLTKVLYNSLIGAWRKIVVHQAIEPARVKLLDPSKVAIVAESVAKADTGVEEAISDVETLGYRDLREKYGSGQRRTSARDRAHDHQPEDVTGVPSNEDTATKTLANTGREEPELISTTTALTLEVLTTLVRKRWHRAPDASQVAAWLVEQNVALEPEVRWDVLEDAIASAAPLPRVPRGVIQGILAWRGR